MLRVPDAQVDAHAGVPIEVIVYALYAGREAPQPFYIGKSRQPAARLNQHRRRFGADTEMKVLQRRFEGESVDQAEARWIAHFIKNGHSVRNLAKLPRSEARTRLTLDIPIALHRQLKSKSGSKGVDIREVVQSLIEKWVSDLDAHRDARKDSTP